MSRIGYANKLENEGATADGKFSAANANEVKASVNSAYDAVDAEAIARASADTTNANAIAAEATARATADTTNANAIAAEATARATADTTNANAIAAEATARVAAVALKLDASAYNDRFKGKYSSYSALTTANPTGADGQYAIVDGGTGQNAQEYIWDVQEGWVLATSSTVTSTDVVAEGSTNLYFQSARVRAVVMTGISFVSAVAGTATDSILIFLGKLQAQVTDIYGKLLGKKNALSRSAVATAGFTAAVNSYTPIDSTSILVPVTLPTTPTDKTLVSLKLIIGTLGFSVTCGGAAVFNKVGGSTVLTYTVLNQSVNLEYDLATDIWTVMSGDLSVSQLDARYAAIAISSITPTIGSLVAGDRLQDIANKVETRISTNESSIASLNSTTAKRAGKYANKGIVAFGSRLPFNTTLSNGTDIEETSRQGYKAIGDISDLNVIFSNYDPINTTTPSTGASAITINATLEYPVGTFTTITFNGGNTTFLLKFGCEIASDLVKVPYIPDGAILYIRTHVLVTSGQKWLKNSQTAVGTEWTSVAVTGSDATGSGTISTGASVFTYAPTAIIGLTSSNKASIFWYGDSIASYLGDTTPNYTMGFHAAGSLFLRAFGNAWPSLFSCIPGQYMANYVKSLSSNAVCYDEIMSCCQFAISNLGINDIGTYTLAQMQANALNLWYNQKARGIKIYQLTLTPKTTSTDGWTTTVNQTVSINESKRTGYNDWLRDGAPINYITRLPVAVGTTGANIVRAGSAQHPLTGYFEMADTAETLRNSGIWKVQSGAVAYTSDGLHPVTAMYILLQANIPTGLFVV